MSAYSNDLRGNDIIDSRDVIARIDELESERIAIVNDVDSSDNAGDAEINQTALSDWDNENGDELAALKSLAEEAEGCSEEWSFGATLIRDDHFEDYAKHMLEDVGSLPRDFPWYIEIDWATTADNLKGDYSSVDFDGETYWVR